jgi:hypothetical protein
MAKRPKPRPAPRLTGRPKRGTVQNAMQEASLVSKATNVRKVEVRFLDHGYYQIVASLQY